MQKIAIEKGGKCLSDAYLSNKTKLRWQCSKKHEWKAIPNTIKQGGWCPTCAGHLPLTIQDMQELAREHGGKCLSDSYIDNKTPLLWQCSKGHQWPAKPNNIKSNNSWCPICSSGKYEQICRNYFEILFNIQFSRVKPLWLKLENGNRLELDGYNESLTIAFEHQGGQHYKFIEGFVHKSEQEFKEQQKRDEIKRKICKQHNILLIEIPQLFTLTKPQDLPKIVKQELENANYSIPEKFNQVIVRKDGLVTDESDDKSKVELVKQLEIW